VGHVERKFQIKGASQINHYWCGMKISRVHCLVLSQSTRVTDRRTDRLTTAKNAWASSRIKQLVYK